LKIPISRRFFLRLFMAALALLLALVTWIWFGNWPNPVHADPKALDGAGMLLVLGGGDGSRWHHAAQLAQAHPSMPLLVTGDRGHIMEYLKQQKIPEARILHEDQAHSTVENAKFSATIIRKQGARKVVLVTNWFHAPRALTIFRREMPDLDFAVSFSPRAAIPQPWDRYAERRERLAALHNLLVYGVWSF
jgi:uncharacterized SAM-binding protein YcdF (DUF218 family)